LDSATIGNIIAIMTALIAIVALICQSYATSKQIKLQNFIEFTKRYQEIILNFPENINDPTFSLEAMSEEAKNNTLRYMRAYFDLCFEEFTLHKKGFIDNAFWEIWRSGMEFAFSKAAFMQAWGVIIQDTKFGTEFEQFVEFHVRIPSGGA
jgi:glycyl-tRNA synthetase alpha subunit